MAKATVVVLVDGGSTEVYSVMDLADVLLIDPETIESPSECYDLLNQINELPIVGPFADRARIALADRIGELDEEEDEDEDDEVEDEDAEDFLDDEDEDEDEVYDPEDEEALEDAERS